MYSTTVDQLNDLFKLKDRAVIFAIPFISDDKELNQLFDSDIDVSVIIPVTYNFQDVESERVGRFDLNLTTWELPRRWGDVLVFMGEEYQFGVKMVLLGLLGGVFTFIYEDKNGIWKRTNTTILFIKKLSRSLIARLSRLVMMATWGQKITRLVIALSVRLLCSTRLIDFLWDTNLRINYNTNESTTDVIFNECYKDLIYTRRVSNNNRIKVVQYIGGLYPGGAERQLCNLVTGIEKAVFDVDVLTYTKLVEGSSHYEDLLKKVSVTPHWAGSQISSETKKKLLKNIKLMTLLNNLPDLLSTGTIELLGALLEDPPDILHAWLDQSNICAGIAGLLADIPVIILSTRNVNPTHFSYLSNPLYKPWYQILFSTGRIVLINNSHPGAEDYSRWLEIPKEKIDVIHNGVDFESIVKSDVDDTLVFKQSYGIAKNDYVIAGVFRFSDEKQPITFLKVCLKVLDKIQNIHVMIAGIGPLETEMRKFLKESNFVNRFHFLGKYKDVPLLLSSADVLLHTSRFEGTPNAVLEAQWLGCPVVATKAGGTIDAVLHEHTGLLLDVDDDTGLMNSLLRLLENDDLRTRYSNAGPAFIKKQFNLDMMVNNTVQVYDHELKADSSKVSGNSRIAR